MDMSPFGWRVNLQPNELSSSPQTIMSERYGAAFITDLPAAKMAAAIMGKDAFLEPFIVTVPESLTGPSMRNISISIFLEKTSVFCDTSQNRNLNNLMVINSLFGFNPWQEK
jgi:hypothetical protein